MGSTELMTKIFFIDQNLECEVPAGTSILEAARQVKAPEGDACGGVCACSTCHVYVEQGGQLLTEATEQEEDILDKAFDVRLTSRLGCQARVRGSGLIRVRISQESLVAYANEHPEAARK
jgi:ferredoxin, 2Fe-2S